MITSNIRGFAMAAIFGGIGLACSATTDGDNPRRYESTTGEGSTTHEQTSGERPCTTTERPTDMGGKDEGCTRTMGFWKNHHANATKPSQQIPWPISEETLLCDQTWLDILRTNPAGGDAFVILARQYIVALLNEASGASTPSEVDTALTSAAALLADCAITDDERQLAIDTAALLDDFNNGFVGPGHCDED